MTESNEQANSLSPEPESETGRTGEGVAQAADRPGGDGTRTFDVIMDLDLPLTVRFGGTLMTLGALARLGPGSEISLDRSASDPVDLLVNGKVIARGDVVAVDGNYAVRITDIVSTSERISNVGG